jgi:hypothetical protein
MLESEESRQTKCRHDDLFPEIQIHHCEPYVSVEDLKGLESISTQSLELGLFQPLLVSTRYNPFHYGGKIPTFTNLPLLTTSLGASRRRLIVYASKSNKCLTSCLDVNHKCSSYGMLSIAHTLNLSTQLKDLQSS